MLDVRKIYVYNIKNAICRHLTFSHLCWSWFSISQIPSLFCTGKAGVSSGVVLSSSVNVLSLNVGRAVAMVASPRSRHVDVALVGANAETVMEHAAKQRSRWRSSIVTNDGVVSLCWWLSFPLSFLPKASEVENAWFWSRIFASREMAGMMMCEDVTLFPLQNRTTERHFNHNVGSLHTPRAYSRQHCSQPGATRESGEQRLLKAESLLWPAIQDK